jgi:hypothetical protein
LCTAEQISVSRLISTDNRVHEQLLMLTTIQKELEVLPEDAMDEKPLNRQSTAQHSATVQPSKR